MQLKVILKKKSYCKKIIIKASGKLGRLFSETWERKNEEREGKVKAYRGSNGVERSEHSYNLMLESDRQR